MIFSVTSVVNKFPLNITAICKGAIHALCLLFTVNQFLVEHHIKLYMAVNSFTAGSIYIYAPLPLPARIIYI